MKKPAILFVCALALSLVAAPVLFAQNVKIDARVNVLAADKANYFNWTLGNKVTKDSFDAASGASLSGSTEGFNAVRYDAESTKKAAVPVTLRGLLLYPVSDFATAQADALTVTANGKALVVRFVHRGTAYELTTDKNGKANVLTCAKSAKALADNVGGEFVLKSEFVKAGGDPKKMSDLDWSKVALVSDAKAADASRWYEGSLDVAYVKGILTIKGNLTEKKAK